MARKRASSKTRPPSVTVLMDRSAHGSTPEFESTAADPAPDDKVTIQDTLEGAPAPSRPEEVQPDTSAPQPGEHTRRLRHLIRWAWHGEFETWMKSTVIAADAWHAGGHELRGENIEPVYRAWGRDDAEESWHAEHETWDAFISSQLLLAAKEGLLDMRSKDGRLDPFHADSSHAEFRPHSDGGWAEWDDWEYEDDDDEKLDRDISKTLVGRLRQIPFFPTLDGIRSGETSASDLTALVFGGLAVADLLQRIPADSPLRRELEVAVIARGAIVGGMIGRDPWW